jgi:hypothetical protein
MATSAKEAIQAIRDRKGFVSQAAKQLGISRVQLYRILKAHPTVKEALDDAREEMKDFAESKIYQKISDGDTTMIIFYAKTQMKDRGYVERQEITGAEGAPVKVIRVETDDLDWDANDE